MHSARYVVLNQDGHWKIVQGGRRYSGSYPSKMQAVYAAIEYAERDGGAGFEAKVLVRHEDGRFITEWMFGHDARPTDDARPTVFLDEK